MDQLPGIHGVIIQCMYFYHLTEIVLQLKFKMCDLNNQYNDVIDQTSILRHT